MHLVGSYYAKIDNGSAGSLSLILHVSCMNNVNGGGGGGGGGDGGGVVGLTIITFTFTTTTASLSWFFWSLHCINSESDKI